MGYIRGEAREQTTMFPATLEELIPSEHMCRMIEAFVGRLNMTKLGLERAEPAETGRPGEEVLDIQVLHIQRIVFDKLAAGFDVFAHQSAEDGFALGEVFEFYREQGASFGVHGGLPELF